MCISGHQSWIGGFELAHMLSLTLHHSEICIIASLTTILKTLSVISVGVFLPQMTPKMYLYCLHLLLKGHCI